VGLGVDVLRTFSGRSIESVKVGPDWTPLKISLLVAVSFLECCSRCCWRWGPQLARSRAVVAKNVPSRAMDHPGLSRLAFWLGYNAPSASDVSFAARNLPRTLTMVRRSVTAVCILGSGAERDPGGTDVRRVLPVLCGQPGFLYHRFCGHPPQVLRQWYGDYPNPIDYVEILLGSPLFFLDLVHICGICLGMILLSCGAIAVDGAQLEVSERRRLGLAVNNVELQQKLMSASAWNRRCAKAKRSSGWLPRLLPAPSGFSKRKACLRESLCGKSQRLFTR